MDVSTYVSPYDVTVVDKVLNEETNEEHVNIHLWCLDRESKPWLIRINDFPAFCYIELPTIIGGRHIHWDEMQATKVANYLKRSMGDNAPYDWRFGFYQKLYYYQGEKKYPMIFVFFRTLDAINHCRNKLSKPVNINGFGTMNLNVYETQVDIVRKLFTVRDLTFCTWFNIKGKEILSDNDQRITTSGTDEKPMREMIVSYKNITQEKSKESESWFTFPRIVAFDIETYSDNHKAMPDDLNVKHVSNIISCIYYEVGKIESRKKYVFVLGDSDPVEGADVICVKNEVELIESFSQLIIKLDPEIISGYNIFAYDYRYLDNRLKIKLKDWPAMGRLLDKRSTMSTMKWKSGAYGYNIINILQMEGRISIDMLPIVKRDYRLDKYSLDFVSNHFLGRTKHDVKPVDMFKAYEHQTYIYDQMRNLVLEETDEYLDIHLLLNEVKKINNDKAEILLKRYELAKQEITRIVAYCFPEKCHQLLTNKGYLFLHEVEELWGPDINGPPADPTLMFAGYNPETKQLVYERPLKLIINPEMEQELVEFTQKAYRSRWDDDNIFGLSDNSIASIRGEEVKPVIDRSNFVSILTTPDHNMYVRRGIYKGKTSPRLQFYTGSYSSNPRKHTFKKMPFEKVKASELLECSGIQLLSNTSEGVICPDRSKIETVFTELSLTTTEMQIAFIELYGYFTGDGTLKFSHGKPWCITFQPVKQKDIDWLKERFLTLNLEWDYYKTDNMLQCKIAITDPRYIKLFFNEYGDSYASSDNFKEGENKIDNFNKLACEFSESIKSGKELNIADTKRSFEPVRDKKMGKWFMDWVWELNKDESRALLSGLRMADGCESHDRNRIHTSSPTFRDEIERLAFHAGYAVYSTAGYLAGTVRNTDRMGNKFVANHTGWNVYYMEDPQFAEPILKKIDGDITTVPYTGRTWCVTMPSTFVVARRAQSVSGFISRASKPVILHNCIQDSDLVVDLFEKLNVWLGLNALSSVVGVPIIQLFTRGQQIRCLSQVYDKCYRKGVVMDRRIKDKVFYNGGFVFEPKPGLYDGVICLDFASLYPSIMRAYNICFTTLVHPELNSSMTQEQCENIEVEQEEPITGASNFANTGEDNDFFVEKDNDGIDLEGVKTITKIYNYKWVRKGVRYGILPEIQDHLVGSRNLIKKELAALEEEEETCEDPKRLAEIKLLLVLKDKYSNALKVSANSLYGFLGAQEGGVLSLIEAAMCITATGRRLIGQVNTHIETKYHGDVVYGDSVTGETPILIRINDSQIHWIAIGDLDEFFDNWKNALFYHGNKELITSEMLKVKLEVWSDKGFTEIKRIIRHKTRKEIFEIRTQTGMVRCTADHSLLKPSGEEIRPRDVKVGDDLMHHDLPQLKNTIKLSKQEIREQAVNFIQDGYLDPKMLMADTLNKFDFFDIISKLGERYYTYDVESAKMYHMMSNLVYSCAPKHITKQNNIVSIKSLGYIDDYVYDLETGNHHFSAGVGRMVVHNTDSSMVDLHIPDFKEAYAMGLKIADEISGTPEKTLSDGTIIPAQIGLFPPPLKIEFEKCLRILCIKKKKYAGLFIGRDGEFVREKNKDGSPGDLKILKRGIIVARRDTAKIVHKTYNKLLKMILMKEPMYISYDLIMKTLEDLVNDRLPVRENLGVIRSLSDKYKSDTYFMKVFGDELTRIGKPPNPSDRLEYVIVRTKAEVEGEKDVKLGLKMRLTEMYEDSQGISRGEEMSNNTLIDEALLLDGDDPLKNKEDTTTVYPPEKIDYEYYIEHIIMSPIDQLFNTGYMKELEKFINVNYTPQFCRMKPVSIIEPVRMIVRILEDYRKKGYTIDQTKVLITQARQYYTQLLSLPEGPPPSE